MVKSIPVIASECRRMASYEVIARGGEWLAEEPIPILLVRVVGDFLGNLYQTTKSHSFKFVTKTKHDNGSWNVTAQAQYDLYDEEQYTFFQEVFQTILSRIDSLTEVSVGIEGILIAGDTWSTAISVLQADTRYTLNEAEIAYETGHVSIEQLHEEAAKPKRKRIQK